MKLGMSSELIVIIVVALILFGGTLIPKIMKNVRKSAKTLKDEIKLTEEELKADDGAKDEQ